MSLSPSKPRRGKRHSRYASFHIGHWQEKEKKHLSRKKVGIALTLLALGIIFAIGNYNIPAVYGDYNTSYSHTRTPIFSYTSVTEPLSPNIVSYDPSPLTDSPGMFGGTGTNFGGECYSGALLGFNGTLTGTKFYLRKFGTPTFTISSEVWSTTGTPGTNCFRNAQLAVSGDSVDETKLTTSFQLFQFNFTAGNRIALTKGTNYFFEAKTVCTSCDSGRFPIIGIHFPDTQTDKNAQGTAQAGTWSCDAQGGGNNNCQVNSYVLAFGTSNPQVIDKIIWNFNSTCISFGQIGKFIQFDYSLGTTGSKGNNCNSADVVLTKFPVNLQTVSGRMLEVTASWSDAATGTRLKAVEFFLRNNGTLPSFSENYDPLADPTVRLVNTVCPVNVCTNGGNNSIYIGKDASKSISQETLIGDLVMNGGSSLTPGTAVQDQFVLNFTGPTNIVNDVTAGGTSQATSQTSASSLQMGLDYFVGLKVFFDTTQTPCVGCWTRNSIGTQFTYAGATLPATLQMFSVPSSCTDPINKAACSLPTAQPVFGFNPLDPSTWGNAIIKGLQTGVRAYAGLQTQLWTGIGNFIQQSGIGPAVVAGLTALVSFILQGLGTFEQLIVQLLNFVGNAAGFGNIGDALQSFISQAITFFTGTFPTSLAQISNYFTPLFTSSSIAFTWGPIIFTFITGGLAAGVAVVAEGVIFVTKFFLFLSLAYGLAEILLFLVYTADFGIGGWHAWFETSKWLLFGTGIKFLINVFNFGLDIITAIMGLVPKPFIQMVAHRIPRIPLVDVHGFPTWPNFDGAAMREGNIPSLIGIMMGVFFLFWYETTNLPGTIASVTAVGLNLNPFMNIFLIFGAMLGLIFMISFPTKIANAIQGMAGGRLPRIQLRPATSAIQPGEVRVAGHKATKRFQKGLERRIERVREARLQGFKFPVIRQKEATVRVSIPST